MKKNKKSKIQEQKELEKRIKEISRDVRETKRFIAKMDRDLESLKKEVTCLKMNSAFKIILYIARMKESSRDINYNRYLFYLQLVVLRYILSLRKSLIEGKKKLNK
jgi:hypothetical protein